MRFAPSIRSSSRRIRRRRNSAVGTPVFSRSASRRRPSPPGTRTFKRHERASIVLPPFRRMVATGRVYDVLIKRSRGQSGGLIEMATGSNATLDLTAGCVGGKLDGMKRKPEDRYKIQAPSVSEIRVAFDELLGQLKRRIEFDGKALTVVHYAVPRRHTLPPCDSGFPRDSRRLVFPVSDWRFPIRPAREKAPVDAGGVAGACGGSRFVGSDRPERRYPAGAGTERPTGACGAGETGRRRTRRVDGGARRRSQGGQGSERPIGSHRGVSFRSRTRVRL